jgi:sugar phosphate isomerase/epimerase
MIFSGFADEAGDSIDKQIQATKELGWKNIESRNVDGINLTDLPDEKFEIVCQKLEDTGVQVHCFGSAIANWGKDPRKEEDFQSSLESLKRAIPRMHRLGTRLIRGMSFAIVRDGHPDDPDLENMIFNKLQILVRLCEEGGVTYVHENCQNYGGLSYVHTLKMLDRVSSPNFKLAFDTGNPVGSDHHVGSPPYHKQSSWEFYKNVRQYIEHVHIKDCKFIAETGETFPRLEHTFPGDGNGDVEKIVEDLLRTGYQGAFSIEPHLAVVYHDGSVTSPEEIRYANYIEYGRRFESLVSGLNVAPVTRMN